MAYYIHEYEGTYKAVAQDVNTSGGDKATYYPSDDVVIQFSVARHRSMRKIDPVEIDVLRGTVIEGEWSGKEGFEDAIFYFHGGILVSDPIFTSFQDPEKEPIFFTEAIMLLNNGDMEHQLAWSDGDFGRWGCRFVST